MSSMKIKRNKKYCLKKSKASLLCHLRRNQWHISRCHRCWRIHASKWWIKAIFLTRRLCRFWTSWSNKIRSRKQTFFNRGRWVQWHHFYRIFLFVCWIWYNLDIIFWYVFRFLNGCYIMFQIEYCIVNYNLYFFKWV